MTRSSTDEHLGTRIGLVRRGTHLLLSASLLLSPSLACRAKTEKSLETQPASATQPSVPVKLEPTSSRPREVVDPGCPHQDGTSCAHPSGPQTPQQGPEENGGTTLFGVAFSDSDAAQAKLSEILDQPESYHEREVIVSGTVQRACSRRGCWMEIAPDPSAEGSGCRVTFKDYGFLVPTDSQGKTARLLGKVQVTIIPAAAVSHYESEGATFKQKRADGTAREVRIVASGVELSKKS